jgi:hypothetical protein
MSHFPRKHRKSGKHTPTTASHEEEDVVAATKSAPSITPSNHRTESPEAQGSRRSSGSSENSEADSPRSMVHGIVEVISARVQTQLAAYLNSDVSVLLAATRAEVMELMKLEMNKIREEHEKAIEELQIQLEAQAQVQKKQAEWMTVEADIMNELQAQQNEYLVLNVGGVVRLTH